MNRLEAFFHVRERGSTVGTELRAGVTTFLTMAYILAVNPRILADAGMPLDDVTAATALGAAVATALMGLYANYPFALAPGMGLNAYFTYGVVKGMGVDWRTALGAVFLEGLLFLALSYGGIRTAVLNALPASIRLAVACGIGLFLALIGLKGAGLVTASPATLVQLGDVRAPLVLLALGGLLLTCALAARNVRGALLLGIMAVAGATWALGLAPLPTDWVQAPRLPTETLWAFDLKGLFTLKMVGVVLAFLFVDIFDTAGTLLAVGRLGGFLTPKGELPGATRAFVADAVGTSAGAALGTSTVTSFIESGAGVREGGRTGLTALVVAGLFVLSLPLVPFITSIPAVATAPALILVGAMMMSGAAEVEWARLDEALPAFLTVAVMPFTYSIANGISAGVISYAAIKLLTGRAREASPVLYVLAVLLVLHYAFG